MLYSNIESMEQAPNRWPHVYAALMCTDCVTFRLCMRARARAPGLFTQWTHLISQTKEQFKCLLIVLFCFVRVCVCVCVPLSHSPSASLCLLIFRSVWIIGNKVIVVRQNHMFHQEIQQNATQSAPVHLYIASGLAFGWIPIDNVHRKTIKMVKRLLSLYCLFVYLCDCLWHIVIRWDDLPHLIRNFHFEFDTFLDIFFSSFSSKISIIRLE